MIKHEKRHQTYGKGSWVKRRDAMHDPTRRYQMDVRRRRNLESGEPQRTRKDSIDADASQALGFDFGLSSARQK